ncbi:hypothetical protein [Ovoidimarina sediminis]|uniref:hypothetical protein n=1 Tax=Ovoidimarina sediminis TaxID=3079856 RepID=UPI00290DD87E|nr:hypothetical protein [Rhodophyticola sp. MJ-SS7]MDU8946749.1 hypothetical protein [Rhodophyticola sp. MJ-SS7]
MEFLVWIGAAITVLGLAGLGWCIVSAARARGEGLDDAAMKARLQALLAWNLASVGTAGIGLMCVVVGLFLGN